MLDVDGDGSGRCCRGSSAAGATGTTSAASAASTTGSRVHVVFHGSALA